MLVKYSYYLKCKKAIELKSIRQGKDFFDIGEYFIDIESAENEKDNYAMLAFHRLSTNEKIIWIPTISQLLEITPLLPLNNSRRFFELIYTSSYFIPNKEHTYSSVEEHLLSFYMHMVHKKIWHEKNEEWIDETEAIKIDDTIKYFDEKTKVWIETYFDEHNR